MSTGLTYLISGTGINKKGEIRQTWRMKHLQIQGYKKNDIDICVLSDWGLAIEGESVEERKCVKMQKNGQKKQKNIKKYRARLRIWKKSCNFALA